MSYIGDRKTWKAEVCPNVAPVAVVGTWVPYVSYGYGFQCYINYGVGGSATFRGDITPGTWSMCFWYTKLPNVGIVKVETSTDEGGSWTEQHAGIDQYSAINVAGASTEMTGIVVPKGKYTILVRYTSTGKNASSSNYLPIIGDASFSRTA